MVKYSIVINCIKDDIYALVLKSWELDVNGNQINVKSVTKSNLTIEQAMSETQNFVNNG